MTTDEPWRESALCRQVDPELFYPEQGVSVHPAVKVCMACEVRAECLTAGIAEDKRSGHAYGVWGGLTPKQRTAYRRGWRGRAA